MRVLVTGGAGYIGSIASPHRVAEGMSLISNIGRRLPSSGLRDYLQLVYHNRRKGAQGRFSKRDSIYKAVLLVGSLHSYDPPFYLVEVMEQYERFHRVRPGETVIDAGAFHGMTALYFSLQVGVGGRVLAVEPDDVNRGVLAGNLSLNPGITNIEVESALLWDKAGEVDFCQRGALGSSALWAPPGAARVRKRATTLDEMVRARGLARVDLVKMDAEGAECNVLRGAQQTIARFRPSFAIAAYHVIDGRQTFHQVEDLLGGFGYKIETIHYGDECLTYGIPAT